VKFYFCPLYELEARTNDQDFCASPKKTLRLVPVLIIQKEY